MLSTLTNVNNYRGRPGNYEKLFDLKHELHADSVFYQPHHQMGLTLEHLVVLPRQSVGMLDGEVKVGGWAEGEKWFGQYVIQ